MRYPIVLSGFLVIAAAALAQPPAPMVVYAPPQSTNCPVQFNALREGPTDLRNTAPHRSAPSSFQLNLQFNEADSARILELKGVLRGTNGTINLEPANTAQSSREGLREQPFQLAGTNTREGQLIWAINVEHLPMLKEVELTEVRFTDGTVWHASSTAYCRVAPGGMRQVASLEH